MSVFLSDPELLAKIAKVEAAYFVALGDNGQSLSAALEQTILQGDGTPSAGIIKATLESLQPEHPDTALSHAEYLDKYQVQRGIIYGDGGWNRYAIRTTEKGEELVFLQGPQRHPACRAEAEKQGFTII